MDSEFLRTDLQSDFKDGLRTVVNIFQELALINDGNRRNIASFQNLQSIIGDTNPTVHNEIDTFSLTVPQQTFQQLVTELGTVHPKIGLHYTERNGILHRNSHAPSYAYKDPEATGWQARDRLQATGTAAAPIAEAALQTEYDRARLHQEGVNRTVAQTAPIWTLLQRDSGNDIRQEDSMLVFLDLQHKTVDWYTVVKNLKKFGEPIGYNLDHYKRCLDRFVGFFAPALKPVTDELPATDLAKFLMRMSLPTPKFERLATQIQSLCRNPGENLRSVLAQLHGLATAYFNDRAAIDQPAMVNRLMITGLMSFTTGSTHKALSTALETAQIQGKTPNWKVLTDSVVNSERVHGIPQMVLSFKNSLPPTTSLFNTTNLSVQSPVHTTYSPIEYSLEQVDPFYDAPQYVTTVPPLHSSTNEYQPALTHFNPRPVFRPVKQQQLPVPIRQLQPALQPIPPVQVQPVQQQVAPHSPNVQSPQSNHVPPQGSPRDKLIAQHRTSSRTKRQTKHYDAHTGAYINMTTYNDKPKEMTTTKYTTRSTDNTYRPRSQSLTTTNNGNHTTAHSSMRQSRTPDRDRRQQSRSPYRQQTSQSPANNYRNSSPSPSRQYQTRYNNDNRGRQTTKYKDNNYSYSNTQPTDKYKDNRVPYQHTDSKDFRSPSRDKYSKTNNRQSYQTYNPNTRSPARQYDYNQRYKFEHRQPSISPYRPQYNQPTRPSSQSASRFPGYVPGTNCSADYQP